MSTLIRSLFATSILASAVALGWYLGAGSAAAPSPEPAAPSLLLAGIDEPSPPTDTTPLPSPTESDTAPPGASTAPQSPDPAMLATLQASLLAEQEAREQLAGELQRLRLTVQRLERQLTALQPTAGTTAEPDEEAPPRRLDVPSLVAVGFHPEDAGHLVQRWGEQQMAELYLRHEARRDGWLNTERYREAVVALRHGEGSLRQELEETDYEAMLYAIGQPNRVVIREVIPASPAELAGLQDGDQLLRYNGTRIYDHRELRQTIGAGDPEELVPVQVARGERTVEVFLPRGPLGVMLGADSVAPGPR